jgi:hypothetical protein
MGGDKAEAGNDVMRVHVVLEGESLEALPICMADMPGKGTDGRPRSITIPDVFREALIRWAAQVGKGKVKRG